MDTDILWNELPVESKGAAKDAEKARDGWHPKSEKRRQR